MIVSYFIFLFRESQAEGTFFVAQNTRGERSLTGNVGKGKIKAAVFTAASILVREMRLELTRLSTHAPQTCLSTYSSTLARQTNYSRKIPFVNKNFLKFSEGKGKELGGENKKRKNRKVFPQNPLTMKLLTWYNKLILCPPKGHSTTFSFHLYPSYHISSKKQGIPSELLQLARACRSRRPGGP